MLNSGNGSASQSSNGKGNNGNVTNGHHSDGNRRHPPARNGQRRNGLGNQDTSRGSGQDPDGPPKLPGLPHKPDPFEGLSTPARRGLQKFLKEEPADGETHYLFLQKHGLDEDGGKQDSEAHRLVQSFTQQRMIAEHNVIPNLEQQISDLNEQRQLLEKRIKAIQHTFGLEQPKRLERSSKPTSFSSATLDQRGFLKEAVKKVEQALHARVIGQPDAISAIIQPLRRAVTGVGDPERPLATLFFAGSTGIGKTLTADVVAETLKDVSPEIKFDYLTINCAEFQNKHEVSSRNLGAPPGYIGFDKGGLFDALKNNPFHVVLLDEIEKADPAFFQLLLQVLEKGEATMANGDKISFKNAIIIMTSNVGTGDLHKALNPFGLNRPDSLQKNQVKDIVDDALGRHFLPEFLNRIDQRVYFQHLTKDDTRKIAGIEVQKVVSRVEASSHTAIEVKPEVYDFLVSKGYSEQYGARNMRRTVQNYIQNKLGDVLFNETAETIANSKFVFGIEKGAIKISRVDRSLPILGEK